MRKLAWFLIFLFLVAFALTLGAAVNDGFKIMLIKSLTYAGGTIYSVASAKWMELATLASSSGTYFLVYTLSILIVGGIFWLAVRKLWTWGATHRPHLKPITVQTPTYDTGIRTSTPVGATTRPIATPAVTTPAVTTPVVNVEPEPTVTEKTEE